MSNFPPQRIEDALKFCCCSPYRDRQICIYAGGGSKTQHDMYWAYAIFDANGDRLSYNNLTNCLDVDDGLRFCEELIDKWDEPVSYEDIRLWRDICEYLNQRKAPTDSHYITLRVPGCDRLVGYDRTHRQKLWDKFKIQLIVYEKFSKKHDGWKLKGNWEDKIDFLEQVYILGRDPDSLPRPWLDKWERKQQTLKYRELADALKAVEQRLNVIHNCDEWTRSGIIDYLTDNPIMLKSQLENLSYRCREAKSLLSKLLRNEPD
ncbi:hypothetical protein FD723_18615 [Nostoc sp. C052]|uniref:hypothetical protein n=1 Tax=Nostoc sp. C052 TaxID=2576902 RepID=UPI0015C341E6|nr:hypothetical protein [Nostoc sp. C052]QLE42234.1 hypothetical protein FD723_18615 [Nostoc sp. C052]